MPEPKETTRKALLALVRGRVQGVGFRYEARTIARSLGITGWITNLPDGGVETYAEGPDAAINRYIAWLNHGPAGAEVQSLDISERKPSNQYPSFTVE